MPGDPLVVPRRIKAKQRQPKSVLAAGRTVTGTGVAARLGEDRHHVQLETDGLALADAADDERDVGCEVAHLYMNGCFAVGQWPDEPVVELGQFGVRHSKFGGVGYILRKSIRVGGHDYDPMQLVRCANLQLSRVYFDTGLVFGPARER